jgi:hypothetical protein
MMFENIDLVDALRRIMDIHTQNYKEDFELDAGLLHSLAASQSSEDKPPSLDVPSERHLPPA